MNHLLSTRHIHFSWFIHVLNQCFHYHYSYFIEKQIEATSVLLTYWTYINFNWVQLLNRVWLFVTSRTAAHQASLSNTSSQSLLKLMFISSLMPSNYLILYCTLLLLPSVFPNIRVFSNESVLHIRWPQYWSFRFNISPSNEYSGLISFRMDWMNLFAVQQTLKSSPTPQFKNINSSVLSFLYSPTLTSILLP